MVWEMVDYFLGVIQGLLEGAALKGGKEFPKPIFKDFMHFIQKLQHNWDKWHMGLIRIVLRNSNIIISVDEGVMTLGTKVY